MRVTIPTQRLKEMVNIAYRGASQNRMLPLTGFIKMSLEDGMFILQTTDSANTLFVKQDKVLGEEGYVVIPVELFSKLIARTTSESVELIVQEANLLVKGNGEYRIPLPVDEDGAIDMPGVDMFADNEETVKTSVLKRVVDINESALEYSIHSPFLFTYYFGDNVITTDEYTICINKNKVFEEEIMLPPKMLELATLSSSEDLKVYHKGNYIIFESEDLVVHGPVSPDIESYPATELCGFLEVEYPSYCTLPKLHLQSVIDRLSLFIEQYDKNGAHFVFTPEGLVVKSRKDSSEEMITYGKSENFKSYSCIVEIPRFKDQIDSIPGEEVTLWYGDPTTIKITADNVTHIIALLDE